MIRLRTIPVGAFGTNCYIVTMSDQHKLWIVDPGAEAELILAAVRKEKFDTAEILLTHAHVDHISGCGEVARALGIDKVHLNAADNELYHSPLNELVPYYPLAQNLPPTEDFGAIPHCTVLDLPGHTQGGSGFLFDDGGRRFLLAGDTIFRASVGRTDLPGGDYETLLDSIRTQILTLPDEVEIFCGHGEPTTVGYERKNNPYLG